MTPRFGVLTSKWIILPLTGMNKNKEGIHFSPFFTNRKSNFFLKFVSGCFLLLDIFQSFPVLSSVKS